MRRLTRDHIIVVVLATSALAYSFTYFDHDLNPSDEGYLVFGVSRVLSGQMPGADFHAYEPGRYWLMAPFFALFGTDVLVERAVLLIHRVAIVVLVFLCGRRFLPTVHALIPTVTTLVLPGPWHKSWFALMLLLALLSAARYLEKPSDRRLAVGGVLSGTALLFRLDLGVFSIVLWGIAHIARTSRESMPSWARGARRWLRFVSWAAVPVGLAGGWYAMQGKLAAALSFYLSEYLHASGDLERIHPKIAGFPSLGRAISSFPENLFHIVIWASIVSFVALATSILIRARRERCVPWPEVLLAATWCCAFVAVAVQPDRSHLLQNGPPLYLVGVAALVALGRELGGHTHHRLAAVMPIVLLGALVAENLLAPDINAYYTGSIRMRFGPQVRAGLPHATVKLPPWIAEEYHGLLDFVRSSSSPGDGVATCFCLPMINVMADRPNPTGLDILFPHTVGRTDQQLRYLAELRKTRFFIANRCELDHDRPTHCPPSDQTLVDFAPTIVEEVRSRWRPVYTSVHGFVTVFENPNFDDARSR